MLNVLGKTKKVEKMFGRMKNILYLCIVKSNQGVYIFDVRYDALTGT